MTRVLGVVLGQAVFIREMDSSGAGEQTGQGIPDIRIKTKVEVVIRLEGGSIEGN